jgi:hypothetical protein
MRVLLTIAVAGSVLATGAIAAVAGLFLASSAIATAADRPSFEVKSFLMRPAQVQLLGAADIESMHRPPA